MLHLSFTSCSPNCCAKVLPKPCLKSCATGSHAERLGATGGARSWFACWVSARRAKGGSGCKGSRLGRACGHGRVVRIRGLAPRLAARPPASCSAPQCPPLAPAKAPAHQLDPAGIGPVRQALRPWAVDPVSSGGRPWRQDRRPDDRNTLTRHTLSQTTFCHVQLIGACLSEPAWPWKWRQSVLPMPGLRHPGRPAGGSGALADSALFPGSRQSFVATPSPTINNIRAPGAVASHWPAAKGRRCRCCTATPRRTAPGVAPLGRWRNSSPSC